MLKSSSTELHHSSFLPHACHEQWRRQFNLTFATLPLTLAGGKLAEITESDRDPVGDLSDVSDDVEFISKLHQSSVPFAWYEEGVDKEPTDPNAGPTDANGTHASYITHHNGPQYFGYISNNPEMAKELHGLGDFFTALEDRTLPKKGGVFFVKGGFQKIAASPHWNESAIIVTWDHSEGDYDHVPPPLRTFGPDRTFLFCAV